MPSPYAAAMDDARDTIVRRARRYKRLVVVTSLAIVACVAAAAVTARLAALLPLLLLPCAVTAFFALDLREVHRWRAGVLGHWRDGALQIDILDRTLRQVPALPAATVEGMLDCLPASKGLAPPGMAASLVHVQHRLGALAEHALLVRSAAWAIAGAGTALGLGLRQPAWLATLPTALALALGWSALSRRRLEKILLSPVGAADARIDFAACREWLPMLSLHGVPPGHAQTWHRLVKADAAAR
jgi:hypothetical protein